MRKYFCDACGDEHPSNAINSVSIPAHLFSVRTNLSQVYVDNDSNRVSGRSDHIDLCNKCKNYAFESLVDRLLEIGLKLPD